MTIPPPILATAPCVTRLASRYPIGARTQLANDATLAPVLAFLKKKAQYMPSLSTFGNVNGTQTVAYTDPEARFVLWALFHQYMDQLHFKNQHDQQRGSGAELKFRMGNNSYRKLMQASGVITATTSASEPRLFALDTAGSTQLGATSESKGEWLEERELTMADTDLIFHDALSGSSTSSITRRRRTETAARVLGTGRNVPTATGTNRRKTLDFPGFCMAVRARARRVNFSRPRIPSYTLSRTHAPCSQMESIAMRLQPEASGVQTALRGLFDDHFIPLIRRLLPRQQQEEAADMREALMLVDEGMASVFEVGGLLRRPPHRV